MYWHIKIGVLGSSIHVYGSAIPRSIYGRFTAFCSIVRMIYLSLVLILLYSSVTDLVFIDGVSAPIPLLRSTGKKVLFYCHFPDQLLCVGQGRDSLIKKLYRSVVDWQEEWSTGCASMILVNSKFTQRVYLSTFSRLAIREPPCVLYPVVHSLTVEKHSDELILYANKYDHVFVSLNRYERKKKVELAIEALVDLKKLFATQTASLDHVRKMRLARMDKSRDSELASINSKYTVPKILLVVAGGYDSSLPENIEYMKVCRCSSKIKCRVFNVMS
jgi:hypothetical protein